MKKLFSYIGLAAGFALAPSVVAAGDLSLTMANGRVTLIAQDVTVRQILAEWARVGRTQIVNGEKVMGPPLTLELRDVPEAAALETILRSAAGYVLAPRMGIANGGSRFERIMILATSHAPAVTAMPPTTFTSRRPQPMMPPVDEDEGDPNEAGPPEQMQQPMTSPVPGQMVVPGPQQPNNAPQGPMTSPRPGPLPQPQVPGNPYQPNQGVRPVPGAVPRPGGGSGGN
jgi:hypothetical protein